MGAADQVVHLHARGPRAARQVRDVLGRTRLRPATLPPSAVLAVRRFDDPLPGGLGPGRRARLRWERAARAALADLHRRAARPRGGRVPETAEAVLFADEAEWRACAAVARALGARPWWADTLPGPTVAAVLAEAPRLGPAIVAYLVGWGDTLPVLTVLSATEADALTATVWEAASVAGAIAGSPAPPPSGMPGLGADVPWATSEPLARAVAEVDRRVGRAQAVLLGVAGTLARAPHRLRRPEAGAAVARWQAGAPGLSHTSSGDGTPARTRGGPDARVADRPLGEGAVPDPGRAGRPAPPPSPVRADGSARPPAPSAPAAGTITASESGPPHSEAWPSPEAAPPASRSETVRSEAEPWPDGTVTGLGGAFFLIHAMRVFGWPEGAEDPWHLATGTGFWGTLEALARALLPGAPPDDPLWRLLASLDGREPGAPPRDAVSGATERPASVPGLPPGLAAWTGTVRPEVEARLVDALDLDGPAAIPEAVLIREATVYATRSHVDVVFPLAAASLAVRRAGLDADPGWVPSAGRVVLFHYR